MIDFVQYYDPKFLALKRSLKTFLAILISLALFYDNLRMAMFAAIISLMLSKSQIGLTLQDRKFSQLTTGLLLALVSVPVSIISQNATLSVIFILVATFATFFLIGLRVVPYIPAIVLLSVMVLVMAFSHTLRSGIEFSGLFLITTGLVFTIHFVILPVRPKVRLKAQLEMILKSLEEYYFDVTADYPGLASGISTTQQSAAKARKAISEYKRLWQLLGMKPLDMNQNKSRFPEIAMGLENLFEYMLLIWQFRARAWESEIFKDCILCNIEFESIINQLMYHYHPDQLKPNDNDIIRIQNRLQTLNSQYLSVYHDEKETTGRKEWVAIFNAVHSLLSLTETMITPITQETELVPEIPIRARISNFHTAINDSIGKLKFRIPAFRYGLRSAIIVGATMAYFKFFEPAYGFWLVMFSILLIRPNLGISIKIGRNRLIGTLAGCLAGFAFESFVPVGNIVFYSVVFLSVFFMIWFANLNKFIMLVSVMTFLIINLFSFMYPSDSGIAWLRLGYTAAIAVFVIFVSFLLWPEKARKKFTNALADTLEIEQQYFLSIMRSLLKLDSPDTVENRRKQLTLQLAELDEIIDATKNEILQVKVIHHGLNVNGFIQRLRNTLHSLDSTAAVCRNEPELHELDNELKYFADHCEEAFESLIITFRQLERAANFPNLRGDFLKVRDSFRAIRGRPDPARDEITRLWNISTFIWNLKPLILELEGIKAEIDFKMDEN